MKNGLRFPNEISHQARRTRLAYSSKIKRTNMQCNMELRRNRTIRSWD
uniref:Uncharacterized protein n=1 Tax=Onchocerca volvulus TaxID=6282 RepID=A0A8R1XWM8_ONCVO